MFSKNNMLLIIFLCVVIVGISYYKTLIVENEMNVVEKFSNLYYANSPIKFKGCSQ